MLTNFYKKNQDYLVLFLFVCFWFGLLSISGTLTSGYHLTDNHEFIKIYYSLEDHGFWETVESMENNSFHFRFLPVLIFLRVVVIYCLGINFLSLSIFWLIQAILTSFILFKFYQNIGISILESLIFTFLVLLGEQSAIWWKLGVGENWGLLFFSTSLLFMSLSVNNKNYKYLYYSLFILFAILSTLCKESFLIIMPSLMIIHSYLLYKQGDKKIWSCIRMSKWTIIILTSWLLIILFIILIYIGTNNLGVFNYHVNLKSTIKFIFKDYYVLVTIIGIFFIIQNNNIKIRNIKKEFLNRRKEFILVLLVSLSIILPQLYLYVQLGIKERYYIPYALGLSFFITHLVFWIRKKNNINQFTKRFYLIIVLLFVSIQIRLSYYYAKEFTIEGKQTNQWLKSIVEHSSPKSTILLVGNSVTYLSEWNISFFMYMNLHAKLNKVYIQDANNNSGEENLYSNEQKKRRIIGYNEVFKSKQIDDICDKSSIDLIALFPDLEKDFLVRNKDWLQISQFDKFVFGGFILYVRKFS